MAKESKPDNLGRDKLRTPNLGLYAHQVGSMLLMSTVLFGYVLSEGSAVKDQVNESRVEYDAVSCPPPPPRAVKAVNQLFKRPGGELISDDSAAQYGLTYIRWLPDPEGYEVVTTDTPKGFNNLLIAGNRMLKPYGVTIELGGQKSADKDGWHYPTDGQLTNDTAKQDVINIMEGFVDQTVEYVHVTGLKKIVLMANTEKTQADAQAFADVGHKNRVVYNLASKGDPGIMPHEEYHLLDDEECGGTGMYNDRGIEDINGKDIYDKDHNGLLSLEDFEANSAIRKQHMAYYKSRFSARGFNGFSYRWAYDNAAKIEKKQAMDVATVSNYAFTNEAEDKAETGAVIGHPKALRSQLDPSHPVLRAKTELILARLYDRSPQIVKWLAAVAGSKQKYEQ
jgi:hypothetical protein